MKVLEIGLAGEGTSIEGAKAQLENSQAIGHIPVPYFRAEDRRFFLFGVGPGIFNIYSSLLTRCCYVADLTLCRSICTSRLNRISAFAILS